MSDNDKPAGPTPNETLFGGQDIEVHTTDGVAGTVRVRQLAVRHYQALAAAQEDEEQQAVLYTGRSVEWLRQLAIESFERIIIEGERINGDFFSRWAQRRVARNERIMPGVTDRLLSTLVPPAASPPSSLPRAVPAG